MLRQYVLTRFNLRLWKKNKFLQPVSDAKWLEERFVLFERYCLPSIVAQTQQNFRWIVLFDAETPQVYKDRVAHLRQECPQLSPIWVSPKDSWYFADIFRYGVQRDLKLLAEKDIHPTQIATTYLDNDDALASDYLERIANECPTIEHRSVITFHYGIQYFEDMRLANQILYKNNHFQTLVEKIEEGQQILTIYGLGSHAGLYKLRPEQALIHEISTPEQPAWVEIVHRKNIGNDVRPTFDTHVVTQHDALRQLANIDAPITPHARLKFCTTFAVRFVFEVVRHTLIRIFSKQYFKHICISQTEVIEARSQKHDATSSNH